MRSFNVATEVTVTDELIAEWVITAFEGGMTYWADEVECVERDANGDWQGLPTERYESFKLDGCGPYTNPEFWENDSRGYRIYDLYEEAWIPKVLTLASLLKALKHQPKQVKGQSNNWFKKVVRSLCNEQYDAGDADILVQVAVFNEVVYG